MSTAFISPITSGALDTALNQLIGLSTVGGGDGGADPRSIMTFGSRLRDEYFEVTRTRKRGETQRTVVFNDDGETVQRFSFQDDPERPLDLTGQMLNALPRINMAVNPTSVEFDQPKRFSRQDTQRGTVFHHFTNDKGQNNDILTINFQGNTGNIARNGRTDADRERAIQRLVVWHNLYQLTREPVTFVRKDGSVSANMFFVTYSSALFPVPITFEGFFSRVLRWSEHGKKPNSREYTMEFTVQATFPDVNTIAATILDIVALEAALTPLEDSKILTTPT